MKNGPGRFNFYLRQLQNLAEKAKEQPDPALWLFKNNARNIFFMLEGLSRIYGAMHDKKKFTWMKDEFKLIEDKLGQTDYYNWLSESFAGNEKINARYKEFISLKLASSLEELNDSLGGWLSGKKFKKISSKLKKAEWLKPSDEVKALAEYYQKSVRKIKEFTSETGNHFDNVEEDIHELRRKIRWLSIYAQATQGMFQYARSARVASFLKKYMTPEITESHFNKLPEPGNNTSYLMLDKGRFLALSWVIARLGELKDEGLLVSGLAETIAESTGKSKHAAETEALRIAGVSRKRLQEILNEAGMITKTFMDEKIPDDLLKGIIIPGESKTIQKYWNGDENSDI